MTSAVVTHGRSPDPHRYLKQKKEDPLPLSYAELYDCPWDIEIDVFPNPREKVAFGSGRERKLYTEDPGHSRFAIHYAASHLPNVDVPVPNYSPPDDRPGKPISRKGYGIGGLSAPRFPYLKEKKGEKSKAKRPLELDVEPIRTVPPQENENEGEDQDAERTSWANRDSEKMSRKKAKNDSYSFSSKSPYTEEITELCQKMVAAFGLSAGTKRFPHSKAEDTVGVGHYDVTSPTCRKVRVESGFGRGPVQVLPSCQTICQFEGFDRCEECYKILATQDYYRSKAPISIPQNYFDLFSVHSEARLRHPDPPKWGQQVTLKEADSNSSFSHLQLGPFKMSRPRIISFCRECYCRIRTRHDYWTGKNKLAGKFVKTRHCSSFHEHHGLPVAITQVSCKARHNLKKKEILTAKHVPDFCDIRLKKS